MALRPAPAAGARLRRRHRHVYPSTLFGDAIEEVRHAGARLRRWGSARGIAYRKVLWSEDGVARLIESRPEIPASQMDSVARYGVGVDLIGIALLQALGRPVPDEMVAARIWAADGDLVPHRGPGRSRRASSSLAKLRRVPVPASWRRSSTSRTARRSGPFSSAATAAAT